MHVPLHQCRRVALVALGVAAVLIAAAVSVAPASAAPTPARTAPTPDKPCGVAPRASAPTNYEHVIWVLMENKSASQVIGSPDAPYINKLAGQCGLATNYSAITHPSLPNYIAMTSGSTQGVTDDANPSAHPLDAPSIFSQLQGDWRGLDESMTSNCEQRNDGRYAVRHNPAAYYTNIRTMCNVKDVPLSTSDLSRDLSAKFTFVTPDVCDDMHDNCTGTGTAGELQTGDAFLSSFIPKLINSTEYQSGNTAIVVTWDEGGSGPNQVVTEVVAPTVTPGTTSGTAFSHYSLLRTTEEMLGLPPLAGAASATSMRSAFGI